MSFKKNALVATGVVVSIGGIAWFLTQTEKGRELTKKAKEKIDELNNLDYHIEEHTFVFKKPYDFENEADFSKDKSTPNGYVVEYSKKEVSPKFLNIRPVSHPHSSGIVTRDSYIKERRERVAKLFKDGYTVEEISKHLIISEPVVLADLEYLHLTKTI